MKRRTFCILGLGVFGSTIAKQLTSLGYEVIAIDSDIACVERLKSHVDVCIKGDFTDIEVLKAAGVADCDVGIVASGSLLEASILAVMNFKELGVPFILAKARNKKYMTILEKIGANKVIRPEKEMGERIAKQLISNNIVDLINIDKENCIIEIIAPKSWRLKSLVELNLRYELGVNVLGIRKKPKEHLSISIDPNYVIQENDILVLLANESIFNKINSLE